MRLALRVAAALFLCAARAAFAQEEKVSVDAPVPPAAVTDPDQAKDGELVRLDNFLDQHPNIEARLREDPGLADNAAFQKNHPQIARFLQQHPGIANELAARPRWFIHRELVRQSATPVTRQQVAEFDRFLDQHPALEKQLARNPQMLRRAEFLGAHPELHDYFKKHPGIGRAAESRPGRLFERAHERTEGGAGKR